MFIYVFYINEKREQKNMKINENSRKLRRDVYCHEKKEVVEEKQMEEEFHSSICGPIYDIYRNNKMEC